MTTATLEDRLTAMFHRQEQLMVQFKQIEQWPQWPLPLQVASSQRLLKDIAWRYVEELTEAESAHHMEEKTRELADATHFMLELLIFSGISPRQATHVLTGWPKVRRPYDNPMPQVYFWHAVQQLGIAMNALRQKPWKQSVERTNEALYRQRLLEAWIAFVQIWAWRGHSADDFQRYYFDKSEIVAQRQQEGY